MSTPSSCAGRIENIGKIDLASIQSDHGFLRSIILRRPSSCVTARPSCLKNTGYVVSQHEAIPIGCKIHVIPHPERSNVA